MQNLRRRSNEWREKMETKSNLSSGVAAAPSITFTPGPWLIGVAKKSTGRTIWRTNGDEKNTGYARICSHVNREADATLIAAAPDLLEALKCLFEAVEEDDRVKRGDYGRERKAARAALAKALPLNTKKEKT
jgi:hypothetical protein